jgi:acetyl-CoA synthetase
MAIESAGSTPVGRDAPDVAWRPGPEHLHDSQLARFLRASGEPSLEALQSRAAADPAWFWGAAADDIGVPWQRRPSEVLDDTRGSAWTRWWGGGAFDYARACTEPRAARDPDGEALVWEGEDGSVRRLSNRALLDEVEAAARRLRGHGVRAGDRVGILLPLLPETVIAVLALGRLGAIYTPVFSGYGAPAVASRLADCDASLLITADAFLRRGSWVHLKRIADDAVTLAPTVRRILVVRRAGDAVETPWDATRDAWWDEEPHADPPADPVATPESPTDPETPYLLIYTSGTTGRPKAAVHVHGGFPIKGLQDLVHQFDLGPGDTLCWFTDLGWMMGPWAISGALLAGARLVLYEGAPDTPGPDRLWSLVARHRITHLGLAPTVIRALMAHGEEPVRSHDLRSLRVLGSTGEPWNPEPWWWYFREVGGGRCPIINYSGGTEVSGGILGGNLLTPIKPASFAGPCIGTAADVVDDTGRSIREAVGELAIRAPLPGMTRGFWRDPARYEETYWSRIPGTWVHGDWARIDADGHWSILGRSDDTLKVAGKRIGPAEVESAATGHRAVLEAAAIGVPHDIKGEAIVVMLVLRPGVADDPGLRNDVATHIAGELGRPLRPDTVDVLPSLPKTRSGKVMRRVIRSAYLGHDPGDISALDDPLTLEAIRRISPHPG